MGAYDILTGTQLCMAVAMIAYGFYFKKKRTCRVWYFSGPAWLIAIWSAVVLYYYSEYPFLTILCFLMGFFLGMGIGLWVKKGSIINVGVLWTLLFTRPLVYIK